MRLRCRWIAVELKNFWHWLHSFEAIALPLGLESRMRKRLLHGEAGKLGCTSRLCPVVGRRPTKKPVSGSPPWSVRQTSSNQGGLQRRTNRDQGRVTWNPRVSQPGSNGEPTGVQQRADRGWRASKQGSKDEPTEVQGRANTDLKGKKGGPTAKYERVYEENHRPHAPCCFLGVDSAALVTSLAGRYLILGRLVCHCLRSLPPLLIPCTKRSRSLTYHQIAKPFWSRANFRTS